MDYILENQDDYAAFMDEDESLETYCRRMRRSKKWGGQLEMNALASRFQFNVIIHQMGRPSMA